MKLKIAVLHTIALFSLASLDASEQNDSEKAKPSLLEQYAQSFINAAKPTLAMTAVGAVPVAGALAVKELISSPLSIQNLSSKEVALGCLAGALTLDALTTYNMIFPEIPGLQVPKSETISKCIRGSYLVTGLYLTAKITDNRHVPAFVLASFATGVGMCGCLSSPYFDKNPLGFLRALWNSH